MSRAGRKRNKARLKAAMPVAPVTGERAPTPNDVARRQPHRMRLYEDVCHDARAMTAFGQLNIIGAIPRELYAAGVRLAKVVRRWREVVDAPRLAPSIAGIGQAGGRAGRDIEDAAARKGDYDQAMGALANAHRGAKSITLLVAVEGFGVPPNGFSDLIAGLTALKSIDKSTEIS